MNFHAKFGVCSSKNIFCHVPPPPSYLCTLKKTFLTFLFLNLFGLSIQTSMQNLDSLSQKMYSVLCSPPQSGPVPVTNLCIELRASRQLIIDNSILQKRGKTRKNKLWHQMSTCLSIVQNFVLVQKPVWTV